MGETTRISWCDMTFNAWLGCQKIGPSGQSACDGRYAAHMMDERFHRVEFGGPGKGPGTRALTSAGNWRQPLKWDRMAKETGTQPFVFGGSLMDPFDHHVPKEWRRRYFDEVIRATPHLVWLLLTKRPHMIVDLAEDAGGLPPNVALGTTAENQAKWDERIGEVVAARAALGALFAFASLEPMLGPINPRQARITASMRKHPAWSGSVAPTFDPIHSRQDPRFRLHWIITGGETDQGAHKARPSHPGWFRRIRNACADTGTAYHHKQHGEWREPLDGEEYDTSKGNAGSPPAFIIARDGTVHCFQSRYTEGGATVIRVGAPAAGRTLDGIIYDGRPEVRMS